MTVLPTKDLLNAFNKSLPRRGTVVLQSAQLLLVAVAARALTFGNPVVHVDEQFYFAAASAMLHGALPYVDVWDRKPIGLFLLYTPAAAAGPVTGIYVYQAMALLCATATATVITVIAARAGWRPGALIAGALYLFWLDLADGQGGQAPVFYNLLIALAVLLSGPMPHGTVDSRQRRARGVGAMALVGLALQIKTACVFEGLFLGLWLVRDEGKRHGVISATVYGAAMVGTAMLPTALVAGYYWHFDAEPAFLFANVTSIFLRGSNPWPETIGNFLTVCVTLAPLVAMALAGLATSETAISVARWRALLAGWLVAALGGLLILGTWFDHYALPAMVPASCCAAGFLGGTDHGRRLATPLLITLALVAELVTAVHLAQRGTAAQFHALVEAVGRGPGCLYVYAPEPMLYPATGRCTITPYLFPDHLSRTREQGAIGVDQATELRRIFSLRPAVVVFGHYRGERPEIHALVARLLRSGDFRLEASRPLGDRNNLIFTRADGDASLSANQRPS